MAIFADWSLALSKRFLGEREQAWQRQVCIRRVLGNEAEHPLLTGPLRRWIGEPGNADAAGQRAFNRGFDQIGS